MIQTRNLLKKNLLLLCFLAFTFSANAQNKSYIANHTAIATILSKKYGIPAAVILAVAAIESSGGNAPVAKVLNNHFGMEGRNSFVNKKGHKSRYKEYSNVFASYVDFCNVISRKRFYKKLKDKQDYGAWVTAMSHAGYSEQPEQWEDKVNGVITTIKPGYHKKPHAAAPALVSAK